MASEETNACPGSVGDLIVFPRPFYDHYAVRGENGDIFHVTSTRGLNTVHGIITVHFIPPQIPAWQS